MNISYVKNNKPFQQHIKNTYSQNKNLSFRENNDKKNSTAQKPSIQLSNLAKRRMIDALAIGAILGFIFSKNGAQSKMKGMAEGAVEALLGCEISNLILHKIHSKKSSALKQNSTQSSIDTIQKNKPITNSNIQTENTSMVENFKKDFFK